MPPSARLPIQALPAGLAAACLSRLRALGAGQADVVVAGGVETMSDVPIKFSKPLRERMLASRKIKSTSKMLKMPLTSNGKMP